MSRASWRRRVRVTCASALAGLLVACAGPRETPGPLQLQAHFDRSSLTGHTTVLVYWASWCEYCERNLRDLSAIAGRMPDSRVRFVGLTADDDHVAAQAFSDRVGLRFPNYFGGAEEARRDHVQSLTTVLLVGPDGQVVKRYTRFANGDMARLEADLRALPGS